MQANQTPTQQQQQHALAFQQLQHQQQQQQAALHSLVQSPYQLFVNHGPRSYPSSIASSTFTTPSNSTTSSPYISPSLNTNGPTSTLNLGPSSAGPANTSTSPSLDTLLVGSRVQVRGPEHIHPKLHPYAHTEAEIVELPSHPNTWYGIRLRDGKLVKLRKSAFDIVSVYGNGNGNEVGNGVPTGSTSAYGPAFASQQASYAPFHFTPYSHHPTQQVQFAPFTQAQQFYTVPPTSTTKLIYTSPEPSPSPTPSAQQQQQQQQQQASHQTLPTIHTLTVSDATHKSDANLANVKSEENVLASEEEYVDDAEKPAGSVSPTTADDHPDNESVDAKMETSSTRSSQVDSSLVLHTKRKHVPKAMSPEAEIEDEDEEEDRDDATNDAASTRSQHRNEDEETYAEEYPSEDGEEEYTETSSKRSSSNRRHSRRRAPSTPSNRGTGGGSAPGSGSSTSSNPNKGPRQRRGRGRALLGLNVVITNGRYKGETGLVIRGANGYYCSPVADHQLLTESGFLSYSQVVEQISANGHVVVACPIFSKDGVYRLEYHPITLEDIIHYTIPASDANLPDSDESASSSRYLVSFKRDVPDSKNNGVDIVVTDNHTMLLRLPTSSSDRSHAAGRRTYTEYQRLTAGVASSNKSGPTVRFLAAARDGVTDNEPMKPLPFVEALRLTTNDHVEAFLELYGYWLGDASMSNNRCVTFQSNKRSDVAYLDGLLARLPLTSDIDVTRTIDGVTASYCITNVNWCTYFAEQYNGSAIKMFWSWVWKRLDSRQCQLITRGLTLRFAEDEQKDETRGKIHTFCTHFRDELVQLLLRAGHTAHFSRQFKKGDCDTIGREVTSDQWMVTYSARFEEPIIRREEIQRIPVKEDTPVWCVNVPTADHLIIMRRVQQVEDDVIVRASRPVIIGNCIKFHRPIAELRSHENTAMKRSSELAPITPNGKRLHLPIPPGERKLIKAQALEAASKGGIQVSLTSSDSSASPPVHSKLNSGGSTGSSTSSKRKAGVSFSTDASPRGDRQRRRKDANRRSGRSAFSYSESQSHDGNDSFTGTGTDEDQSQYDENDENSSIAGSSRSRSRTPSPGRMYTSDDEYNDAPRLSHSRSHSSSSSRSSSPSQHSSIGSQSPTRTELLSPSLQPYSSASVSVSASPYALAPSTHGGSIPSSPYQSHHSSHASLPSMSLGPRAHDLLHPSSAHKLKGSFRSNEHSTAALDTAQTVNAASILLALSHEGLLPHHGHEDPSGTIGGSEIPIAHQKEQWLAKGHHPHVHTWQTTRY